MVDAAFAFLGGRIGAEVEDPPDKDVRGIRLGVDAQLQGIDDLTVRPGKADLNRSAMCRVKSASLVWATVGEAKLQDATSRAIKVQNLPTEICISLPTAWNHRVATMATVRSTGKRTRRRHR